MYIELFYTVTMASRISRKKVNHAKWPHSKKSMMGTFVKNLTTLFQEFRFLAKVSMHIWYRATSQDTLF